MRKGWLAAALALALLLFATPSLAGNANATAIATAVAGQALRGLQASALPPKTCQPERYEKWKLLKYKGPLATDTKFWRYQTQTVFVLTNGLAIDLATAKCKDTLNLLTQFRSGRSGPVDEQHVYKAMCTAACLQNDAIHLDALTYTGCQCTDLSTQKITNTSDPKYKSQVYHTPNDFCMENSARLLCSQLGFCGVLECKVSDFMCPRFEWNKKKVPLKGLGSCMRHQVTAAGPAGRPGRAQAWATALLVLLLSLLLAVAPTR